MKTGLLSQVKDAEARGTERIQAAEEEARRIINDGRRKAEQTVNDGKAQVDDDRQSRLETARQDVAAEADAIIQEGRQKADSLRKKFESGVKGATERAVKIIEENL